MTTTHHDRLPLNVRTTPMLPCVCPALRCDASQCAPRITVASLVRSAADRPDSDVATSVRISVLYCGRKRSPSYVVSSVSPGRRGSYLFSKSCGIGKHYMTSWLTACLSGLAMRGCTRCAPQPMASPPHEEEPHCLPSTCTQRPYLIFFISPACGKRMPHSSPRVKRKLGHPSLRHYGCSSLRWGRDLLLCLVLVND